MEREQMDAGVPGGLDFSQWVGIAVGTAVGIAGLIFLVAYFLFG